MIPVYVNNDQYQYDIHALVKAFFPEEEVKVSCDDRTDLAGDKVAKGAEECKGLQAEMNACSIYVVFEETECRIRIRIDTLKSKAESIDSATSSLQGDITYTDSSETIARSDASTNGTSASASTPKNALKQLLYNLLTKYTDRQLPWGALTGIRPTKIAYRLLENGTNDKEIIGYLKNVYFVSDKKTQLSIQIAKTEKSVLDLHPYKSGYTLYVGIPFCPTRCDYCSFAAVPIASYKNRVADYLDALKRELAGAAQIMGSKRLDTLYIGGGTPTALSAGELDELLFFIEEKFDLQNLKEYTVEAGRPDSILEDSLKLRRLKEHRVSRICVNPQSFVQKTLDKIGRKHTVEQTIEAFQVARSEGFDNINMDIIVGLPGEGIEEMKVTTEHLKRLRPDDLTIHSLSVKRGSAMQAQVSETLEEVKSGRKSAEMQKNLAPVKSDTETISEVTRMMEMAEDCAKAIGLEPYYLYRQKNTTGNMENTGYARKGCYGISNILGMEDIHSVMAVGAGAVTKRVYKEEAEESRRGLITRCGNVRDINQYIARVDEMMTRKEELFSDR